MGNSSKGPGNVLSNFSSTKDKNCARSVEFIDMEIDHDVVNPLNVLISAAATRNPMQYQLPNELSCTVQLPGIYALKITFNNTYYDYRYYIKSTYDNIAFLQNLW